MTGTPHIAHQSTMCKCPGRACRALAYASLRGLHTFPELTQPPLRSRCCRLCCLTCCAPRTGGLLTGPKTGIWGSGKKPLHSSARAHRSFAIAYSGFLVQRRWIRMHTGASFPFYPNEWDTSNRHGCTDFGLYDQAQGTKHVICAMPLILVRRKSLPQQRCATPFQSCNQAVYGYRCPAHRARNRRSGTLNSRADHFVGFDQQSGGHNGWLARGLHFS